MPDTAIPAVSMTAERKRARLAGLLREQAAAASALSYGEQALWLLNRSAPNGAAYHFGFAARVLSPIDRSALRAACAGVLERHPQLRTTYPEVDGRPMRRRAAESPPPLDIVEAAGCSESQLHAAVLAASRTPFRLDAGPLLRVTLFTRAPDEHVLLLCAHHIVWDGWSTWRVLDDLRALYEAAATGRAAALPAPKGDYVDHVRWQTRLLHGPRGEALWRFWQDRLAGPLPVLDLPTDRPRPSVASLQGASHAIPLPAPLVSRLHALARAQGASAHQLFLAAFAVLLKAWSGQDSVLIGTATAGRTQAEFADTVGYFVNPVVARVDIGEDPGFATLLGTVRHTLIAALEHQEFPFPLLVERLRPERSAARSPIFQAFFSYQGLQSAGALAEFAAATDAATPETEWAGLRLAAFLLPQQEGQFDVALEVIETAQRCLAVLKYATDLFTAPTIAAIGDAFHALLDSIASDPGQAVSRHCLLTPERRRELAACNATAIDFAEPRLVHELIAGQARRVPDRVALTFGGRSMTYAELDRRADGLARHLVAHGVRPDDRVGICLERSFELLVAVVAVLKAGAAFLPLDPDLPAQRLAWMTEAAEARLIIAKSGPPIPGLPWLDPAITDPGAENAELPQATGAEDTLAYVIFTSGSTGRPKGAAISHAALRNRLLWMQQAYRLTGADAVLQKTPIGFDVSVWELLWPLMAGARLVIAPPGLHRDPVGLAEFTARAQVSVAHFVPSMLRQLLAVPELPQLSALRLVFCSGEVLTPDLRDACLARLPAELHNLYGPTEAAIDVTAWPCRRDDHRPLVPIGHPIANTAIQILDRAMQPLPVGMPGELFIGGVNLARGYCRQPGLTAERFVPDPAGSGQRLYRTGDRARRLADGSIEYLGRLDQQVKLRGVRIETGEIEHALRQHPAIGDAAVAVGMGENGPDVLIAYCTPAGGPVPAGRHLARFLAETLPAVMVPSQFVVLDTLPLTASGKLDRKALPTPAAPTLAADAGAPRSPVEEVVAGIWADLLRAGPLGPDSDFFALGGHSLLVAMLVNRISALFGPVLSFTDVFEAPRIGAMAARIEAAQGKQPLAPIPATAPDRPPRLSFGQRRLWLLDQLEGRGPGYNMPGYLELRGILDLAALEAALRHVLHRHAPLRTMVALDGGEPVAVIADPNIFTVRTIRLDHLDEADRQTALAALMNDEARRPFDLAADLPLRATLVTLAPQHHRLLLTLHHIAADGWSIDLLLHELSAAYNACRAGRPPELPPLPVHYPDFAAWQHQSLQDGRLENGLAFWTELLDAAPPAIDLPADRARPDVHDYRGASEHFAIPAETVAALRRLGQRTGATLFMIGLAAFATLLQRHGAGTDIVIGTPVAGRDRREVEPLVGLFMNLLPLRVDLSGDPSVTALLHRARALALAAWRHQEVPFELLVDRIVAVRSLRHAPLFQVLFVLQHAATTQFEFDGLACTRHATDTAIAKYDLTLELAEAGDTLAGRLEYSTALFDRPTILRLRDSLCTLLAELPANPDRRIASVPIMPPELLHRVLRDWNATDLPVSPSLQVHDAIAAQAARRPDAIAVVSGGASLTYRELLGRAGQLGRRLRALGVGPERPVGVLVPRSQHLPVALLGILLAGGAFLPLDARAPQARLVGIMRDAQAHVVVAQGSTLALAARLPGVLVDLDATEDAAAGPLPPGAGDALAYVIYTSGSTGQPKGVEVEHCQVVNFFAAMDRLFGASPGTWLALTSVAFDISVLELLWTLSAGCTVVMQGEADAWFSTGAAPAARALSMDYSLCFFGNAPRQGATGDQYTLLLDAALFADTHGFTAIWTPERHFHQFGGLYPNPAIMSAALAATTQRIGIRAGSVVLPLHDPLRVAEDWALVDNLACGRIGVSVASGWHADDFSLAPDRYADRKRVMVDGIDTLRRLWRGETIERANGLGRSVRIGTLPRPVQSELPLWLTSAGSPETFTLAGELGCSVLTHLLGQSVAALREKIALYRQAWRNAGHAGEPHVTLMIHTLLGDDRATVLEQVRAPFSDYLRTSFDLIGGLARELGMAVDPARLTQDDEAALLSHAFERYASANALFGTPESVLPLIAELQAAGVNELACLVDFGVDASAVLAGLEHVDRLRRRCSAPPAETSDRSLPAQMRRHAVTHLQCTPTLAQVLAEQPGLLDAAPLTLLVGGEALPASLAQRLCAQVKGPVWNMYGPTETTIWSAAAPVDAADPVPSIGRPIGNTQIYVLDAAMQPVPPGTVGEIYIGGAGVARGYRGQPAQTAARFLPDPFAGRPGACLHRTGDLGRHRASGELEVLGRIDGQVKIRGIRTDPAEAENVLRQHPDVAQAAVSVRHGAAGPELLAHVRLRRPIAGGPAEDALRRHLQENLPDNAIPRSIVLVEQFPLTSGGKIDRKALPSPQAVTAPATTSLPRTPVEDMLAAIWCRVLARETIGRTEDFFLAGGNSLLAIQAAMLMRDAFGVEVPVRTLFEASGITALAERIETLRRPGSGAVPPPIRRRPRPANLPLSFAQQRLWFLDKLEGRSAIYSMPGAVRLQGTLDVGALAKALSEISRRHEATRTRFRELDGTPTQVVAEPAPVALPVVDLMATAAPAQSAEVARLARAEAALPFDLAQDILLRATLLRLDEMTHVLLLTMHHIVSDGWSLGVLVDELSVLYSAFARGQASPLPELPAQYADFTLWQRDWLQGEVLDRHLDYWRAQLAGAPPLLELPVDRPRSAAQTFQGGTLTVQIPASVVRDMAALCRASGATLFMGLLTVFATLVARYTGRTDIIVGTPAANRRAAQTDGLIGFFVNTLVMRLDLTGQPGTRALLGRVREVALAAFDHQDLPFERLVEELRPVRALSHSPLFQVMFILQNAPAGRLVLDGLTLTPIRLDSGTAKFDLTLSLTESEAGLEAQFEYNSHLFDRSTIERLAGHYVSLLHQALREPDTAVASLALLEEAERRRLLVDWNVTAANAPGSVLELFRQQVAATPDCPALRGEGVELSYAVLDAMANRIAHRLLRLGVRPDDRVAVWLDRSPALVIALLGILKSGAAPVPLDLALPQHRIGEIIDDAAPRTIVTAAAMRHLLPDQAQSIPTLLADADDAGDAPDGAPDVGFDPARLAYLLYTSGSTGKPKGIAMPHRPLANLIAWHLGALPGGAGERTLQFTSTSFDVAFQEIFATLCSGGTLVLIADADRRDPAIMLRVLSAQRIERLCLPFAALQLLAEAAAEHQVVPLSLRHVITAGEALQITPAIAALFRRLPDCKLHNHYGPTETHVVTAWTLPNDRAAWPLLPPIGRPVANARILILDEEGAPVPIGVPGHLHVGGMALARGYFAAAAATAERFVPDPFGPAPGGRLYRTGDLAVWRADGVVEYRGRIDRQVKIRGHRVEIDEVEAVLGRHPDVVQIAITPRQGSTGFDGLVAHVVPAGDAHLTLAAVRGFAQRLLPEAMVPVELHLHACLPMTVTGKVDRRTLATLGPGPAPAASPRVAPGTPTEQCLAAIWTELLGDDQGPIGRDDDFFARGGHSLLATQVVSRVRRQLDTELPIRIIFETPVLAELAARLDAIRGVVSRMNAEPAIDDGDRDEFVFS